MLKVEEFIRENGDWKEKLQEAPYFLKINEDEDYALLKYDMTQSDFTQEIVKECRGIIIDKHTNKAVALSFKKFFNIQEELHDEIDWKTARVTEKVDGCLSEESLILTQYGLISIRDITQNPNRYRVLTYNHKLNKVEFNDIEAVSVEDNSNKTWYELDTDIGKITLTGNHQVWCKNLNQYKRVDELDGTEILEVVEPNKYGESKCTKKYSDLYFKLFPNKDLVLKEYYKGVSVKELSLIYNVPYATVYQFLNIFCKEHIRNISESKTDLVKDKTILTLRKKYSNETITNCSQLNIIKDKKKSTFIKHYGVDNIRKADSYKKYCNEIIQQRYGTKRVCNQEKRLDTMNKNKIKDPNYYAESYKAISNAAKERWKNYTEEQKQEKIKEWHKNFRRNPRSNLEIKIFNILIDAGINCTHSTWINKPIKCCYDIRINNKLLEINGDYWHANPAQYKENDILRYKNGIVTAKGVWDKDFIKKNIAEDNGYKVYYIWESEVKNLSDNDILDLVIKRCDLSDGNKN